MKFTLSWLKEHLDTDLSLDALAEKLTALGLEVDGIEDRGATLAPFVIGEVLTAEPHPNADRLKVCTVTTGRGEPAQVVCGAPNARAGMKGVFAPPGSHIPGTGLDLKKGVIRGVDSNGMLCSERELGLSDEHTGIMDLPVDAPLGMKVADYLGLHDPVIDIGLTPDRADCAGVRGIARDLAAAGAGTLKPFDTRPVPGTFDSPIGVSIDLPADQQHACPAFIGRTIRGVTNGPSPKWLQDKLVSIGLRPISALVDITNYFTFDQPRPLHVFDAGKVTGDMVITLATGAEGRIAALNDKAYDIPAGACLISDRSGPISLGGIVGGASTGVTENTTDVFLEVALFDPIRTASTGRTLAIESDARYRFERGLDAGAMMGQMEAATRLILEVCGGEASEPVIAGAIPQTARELTLRTDRVADLGGLDVPVDRQIAILQALGFTVRHADHRLLAVTTPTWRLDVQGEADLVEEILRVEGFDAVPAVPLPRTVAVTRPAVGSRQRMVASVKRALSVQGMDEAVTWSFMDSGLAARFGLQSTALKLVNPIASDLDAMRPSVLPNLLQAAARNAARGYADVGLFEVGPTYRDVSPTGQMGTAAGVRTGKTGPRHWAEPPRPVDAFDAKADAVAALEAAGAPVDNLQTTADAPDWYHPGRSGVLRLGATVLAHFGEVHPGLADDLGLKGPVAAFEVFLGTVPERKKKPGTAKPKLTLSPFQPLVRDFAFIVDAGVAADRIVRAAKGSDKKLVAGVEVFDLYQGKGVEDGKKSVAVAVTLQPVDATLTDAQIDAVATKLVAAVTKATGAVLRG